MSFSLSDRLFKRKYSLLVKLRDNLRYLDRQLHYTDAKKYLFYIIENERIIRILERLDKQQARELDPWETFYHLLEECLELQKKFEIKWREFAIQTKIDLTELEVKRQLRKSLREEFE